VCISFSVEAVFVRLAGGELADRLEEDREDNNRIPQTLTVSFSTALPWVATHRPGKPVQFSTPEGRQAARRDMFLTHHSRAVLFSLHLCTGLAQLSVVAATTAVQASLH
jgi:hypothetical protein